MLSRNRIRVDPAIFEVARNRAAAQGYASVEEYVTHLIELDTTDSTVMDQDTESVIEKMKGLGYLE